MTGFRHTLAVIVASAALLTAAVPAGAAKFYKWVDEKGVTHYTEKAPVDSAKSKVTTVKVGDTTSSDADVELKALADRRNASNSARQKEAEEEAAAPKNDKERDQKLCDQHRKNLATLKSGTRILTKDAKGNQTFLTDEQVKQQLQVSESEVQRCDQHNVPAGAGAAPSPSKNAP